jgi:hypothetical protein
VFYGRGGAEAVMLLTGGLGFRVINTSTTMTPSAIMTPWLLKSDKLKPEDFCDVMLAVFVVLAPDVFALTFTPLFCMHCCSMLAVLV